MAFKVKRRGKVTYYYEGETPVLSSLVVETLPDNDLKIHFRGSPADTRRQASLASTQ